jgi:hypothetical protein
MGVVNQNRGWRKGIEMLNEPMRNVGPAKDTGEGGGGIRVPDMIQITDFLFTSGPRWEATSSLFMLLRWELICHLSDDYVVSASGCSGELNEARQINMVLLRPIRTAYMPVVVLLLYAALYTGALEQEAYVQIT